MKLQDPAIVFRGSRGTLCAKSTADDRWYKVQGITKTLESIKLYRKRARKHNMISMDMFTRVVRDLNANPHSSLEWVPGYVRNLNAPNESHGLTLKEALLQLLRSRALTPEACRLLWDKTHMSSIIGTVVDAQCKDVFNEKKTIRDVGPVSRLILTQLKALRLTPICAGLKVAGVPRPDRFSGSGSGSGSSSRVPGAYTYHNGCTRCTSIDDTWGFYTEVDLVAQDTVRDNVVLLELKTRNNDELDPVTLWRYNTQLWLTWLMFSLTYPSMAERSAAYLVIVRPGTNKVDMRGCSRPTISRSLRSKFPWLNSFCPQVLNCLTPTCVNMRVETRLASAEPSETSRLDETELSYRNKLFNDDKKRFAARGLARQSEDDSNDD